jgi:hypothetical protein
MHFGKSRFENLTGLLGKLGITIKWMQSNPTTKAIDKKQPFVANASP